MIYIKLERINGCSFSKVTLYHALSNKKATISLVFRETADKGSQRENEDISLRRRIT